MDKTTPQNYLSYSLPMAIRAKKEENKHEFTISDATLDRYGTVIPISAWNLENFGKGGNFYYQHESSQWNKPDPDYVLGPARAWIEDNVLVGEGTYEPAELNPLADTIRRKVEFGTLKSTSVGFIAKRGHWGVEKHQEDPDVYYFDEVELLEFSIVNIPANPNATKRSIDEFLKCQTKEKREITPPETIPQFPNPGEGHPHDRTDRQSDSDGGIVPFEVSKARSWLTLHQSKTQ